MEQQQNDSQVNKKKIVKLKTLDAKPLKFQSKTSKEIELKIERSHSTKFPVQFVPRLCPMKSKIVPTPLKLNKNKDEKIKQLSDDEAAADSSELFSSSSSSNTDLEDNIEYDNSQRQSKELSQEEIIEGRKKSSFKYNNVIEAPIQELNEDKDLSDDEIENNIKKNKKDLYQISPINEADNRFSGDMNNFKLEEEDNKEKEFDIEIIEFEKTRTKRFNSIKNLRKRMTRIKTRTIEVKCKETIDSIHKNLKKTFNFEKSSEKNVIVKEKENNEQKKEVSKRRKKSLTILEMLSFNKKYKK